MGTGFRGWARAVAALAAACACSAWASLGGELPFTRHAPDIEVYPQNFALAQDDDGIVYVGNSEGLLSFDGERWERIALPRKDLVRSLAYDGHGRVYVGGFDAFGYVERDAAGAEVYHDLATRFAPELGGEAFADIWDVRVTRDGVFFRALRHVFLYEPQSGATRLWRHPGRFGAIGEVDGALLLQFRGQGLRRYQAGDWVAVAGGEALKDQVYQFIPLATGGALLTAPTDDWRIWRDGQVVAADMPAGFPPASSFGDGRLLDDGIVALPSDDGWLYLLDLAHGRFRRSRLDSGFLDDVIPAVDGGLLVGGDEALYHVDWPAPWTVVGAASGISGSMHVLRRWGDRWYVLGGMGALREDAPGSAHFVPSGWPLNEAWDLLALDERRALIADSHAVMLVEGGKATPVTHSAVYPRVLVRSRFDDDLVFVGTEPGLALLRRDGNGLRLVAEKADMQNLRVTSIVEPAPHTLWLGSERAGVWRVKLAEDDGAIVEARQFLALDGIEYGELATGYLMPLPAGGIAALTARGQYRWNGERFERFDLDGLDAVRGDDETVDIRLAPDGTRWAYSYNHVYRQPPGQPWQREELGGVRRGALESLTFDEDGAAVFSASYALLRYDSAAAGASRPAPRLLLRSLSLQDRDGTTVRLPLTRESPLELRQQRFALAFRFALPDLRRPDLVRYAARLRGVDDDWSDWTADPTLVYKRVPPGRYTLELRARDSRGQVIETAPLAFVVHPAWYVTPWAWTLWVLAATGLLWLLTFAVVRWRTARLAAERTRLQLQVAERTAELELANRRLDSMAHLDGLTGIANRRRLDDALEQAWTRCAREATPLSLLAIDVDRFKSFNDEQGHLAGDELLRELSRTLAGSFSHDGELLARYGGDEFMAILPLVGFEAARSRAERLRRAVEGSIPGMTVSIGVATREPHRGGWVAELIGAADAALYQAKSAGRNRVAGEPVVAPAPAAVG